MSQNFDMIAKTFHGMEQILADEIQQLGGTDIEVLKRAVAFSGSRKLLYRMNYESRFAMTVLVPIFGFTAKTTDDIYQGVQRINWADFISVENTFSIQATINSEIFTHSRYVVLKVKDAIADQFRDKFNERPSVDPERPDLKINIHITDEEVTVSLDSTGEPLYKRGYRKRAGEAHLNEVLAAGLIKLSGWDGKTSFLDPMCGSGTFLCEAGMLATGIPSGKFRKSFGFQQWKDFDEKIWTNVKKEADANIHPSDTVLTGFDIDPKNVDIARLNAAFLKDLIHVSIVKADMLRMKPPYSAGFAIINPPYGERLTNQSVFDLYGEMGTVLKHQYAGYKAWIISSNFDALKNIGLKPSKKYTVYNGPLECKYQCFDLYQGSKKSRAVNQD